MQGQRITMVLALAASALLPGLAAQAAADVAAAEPAATQQAAWHHTKAELRYFGFTTRYTCNGMESQVRRILTLLGARKGAKVRAIGCEHTAGEPNRDIRVSMEFDTLVSATGAASAESVSARWAPVAIMPNRPSGLQNGDCELIEQLRDVLTKNIETRNLEYRTSCVPHQQGVLSWSIRGEVLKPVAQ